MASEYNWWETKIKIHLLGPKYRLVLILRKAIRAGFDVQRT